MSLGTDRYRCSLLPTAHRACPRQHKLGGSGRRPGFQTRPPSRQCELCDVHGDDVQASARVGLLRQPCAPIPPSNTGSASLPRPHDIHDRLDDGLPAWLVATHAEQPQTVRAACCVPRPARLYDRGCMLLWSFSRRPATGSVGTVCAASFAAGCHKLFGVPKGMGHAAGDVFKFVVRAARAHAASSSARTAAAKHVQHHATLGPVVSFPSVVLEGLSQVCVCVCVCVCACGKPAVFLVKCSTCSGTAAVWFQFIGRNAAHRALFCFRLADVESAGVVPLDKVCHTVNGGVAGSM